jgi:hypothetical protein
VSTAGQPTVFSELYGDLLSRMRADTTASGGSELIAKRYLNIALHDVHIQQNWPWAERTATIITRPPYEDGSVSIAAATRTALEGTNTLWNTAVTGMGFNNANVGAKLKIGTSEVYKLSAVGSDTAATLQSRYVENITTASAYALAYSSYAIYQDEYALASDFFRLVDARQFSDVMNIPVLGSQEFYRRFPRNATRGGAPEKCTIIELGPSASTDWQPRVVFFPYPNTSYQIPYRYMTRNLAVSSAGAGQTEMSADTDEPIIPVRYRHILLSYASFLWYRDQKDDARAQDAYQEYVDGVKRIAGDSSPQRDKPRLVPVHMTRQPVFARGRGSRFSTNPDAWDAFRE